MTPNQSKINLHQDASDEPAQILFPDDAFLQKLKEQLRRQNILGVRELITELEQQPRYRLFLDKVRPYLKNYRFKQLVESLENWESLDKAK